MSYVGYLDSYPNCYGYGGYSSYSGYPIAFNGNNGNIFYPNTGNNPFQKNEKVGFWEGIKAIGKGLIKPITNIFKHPLQSAFWIGLTAAAIVATGGAITPLLVAGGLAFGGIQVGKGAYNFFASDTRQETLAALEDIGEGTFIVGASVAGAKSYASSTSAGSATAKFGWIKGLGKDVATTVRAVPNSAQETLLMIRSGEFTANLQAAATSGKLALQNRQLAKMRQEGLANTPEYKTAYRNFKAAKAEFVKNATARQNAIFDKYFKMNPNAADNPSSNPLLAKRIDTIYNQNPNMDPIPGYRNIIGKMNIIRNAPEENMALGLSSYFGDDPEAMAYAEAMVPYSQVA